MDLKKSADVVSFLVKNALITIVLLGGLSPFRIFLPRRPTTTQTAFAVILKKKQTNKQTKMGYPVTLS